LLGEGPAKKSIPVLLGKDTVVIQRFVVQEKEGLEYPHHERLDIWIVISMP